jgi:formylglycine-generating enzyme required for sulfatase activity
MRKKFLSALLIGFIVAGSTVGRTEVAPIAQTPAPPQSLPTATPQPVTLRDRATELWQTHQLSVILAGLLLGGYLSVWWLRPLWLLKLPSQDLAVPWTTWKVPLGMVRWFKYRDRVLDTWVKQHWKVAQQEFLKFPTVDNRAIHIPLPVQLDRTTVAELTGAHLVPTFQKKTAVLLLCGEGGAGKTSLACQIAQWGLDQQLSLHRMIPVLLETELDHEKEDLLAAIQGRLNKLTDQPPDSIEPEFLKKLLQRQRVLVIVDHLSEMGEATRSQINPQLADFPAKALVVTSRLEESFGGLSKTVIKPLQVEANRLWPFMSAYLEAKGKQDLFVDDEYADGSERLRRMAGERSITVLLARMYIDQMIREREGAGGIRPDSVPKLMLSYLNQLNLNIEPANKRDDLEVQRDAKIVAWECLKQTYRPVWIKKGDAIAALDTLADEMPAKDRLHYLERRLQFLQTPEPGDSTRIILDPLAEYLAAAHLVEQTCQQADPAAVWQQFFADIDQKLAKEHETPEIIRGFLLAVRDCCLDNANDPHIPDELPDQLARKANLDPDELRRMQENRRIRRLIAQLSVPEESDRIDAVTKLSQCGMVAKRAEPNLVGMLENRSNQTLAARQAAARALGTLGIGEAALLVILQEVEEDLALRRSAAEALGQMKAGRATLLQILQADEQPLTLLQGAARAIGLIGAPSGKALPMLISQLRDGEVITEVKGIRVWRETLPEDLSLELVAIPGGEFLMGSPPDETGRDIYFPTYQDTEGLDVEAQHRVTIPPFWMGQYPITQAQWRVVAALPAINRDLELNPSSFKGDNLPVEQVTWYDAIEFCDRLSQYTGKTYRLPSEPEWEYACRAGTSSPFFFGDTVSAYLANYRGTYTYGEGVPGEFRETTTEVGSFGVNAFGLADMHGNVYDWCLDHWHPSYEGAPRDGSAWITGGNDNYRIVRGGSWYVDPAYCRSAFRNRLDPGDRNGLIGFRVVCVSPWT